MISPTEDKNKNSHCSYWGSYCSDWNKSMKKNNQYQVESKITSCLSNIEKLKVELFPKLPNILAVIKTYNENVQQIEKCIDPTTDLAICYTNGEKNLPKMTKMANDLLKLAKETMVHFDKPEGIREQIKRLRTGLCNSLKTRDIRKQ